MGGKIKSVLGGIVAVIVLGLFLLVKGDPMLARKAGLGFLVPADSKEMVTATYNCRIDRKRAEESSTTLVADLTCTVVKQIKVNHLEAEIGLKVSEKQGTSSVKKQVYKPRERIVLAEEQTIKAGESKTWPIRMAKPSLAKPSLAKSGTPLLTVEALFLYPDEFAKISKGDMNKQFEASEQDKKDNPDKYQLRIRMEL